MATKSEETHGRILKAFVRCLHKMPYNEVSVRVIAAEAGVALSSIYYYYKSKDDILLDAIHISNDYFIRHFRELVEHSTAMASTRAEFIAKLLETISSNDTTEDGSDASLICFTACTQAAYSEQVRLLLEESYSTYFDSCEQVIAALGYPDPDPAKTARSVCCLLDGTIMYETVFREKFMTPEMIAHIAGK